MTTLVQNYKQVFNCLKTNLTKDSHVTQMRYAILKVVSHNLDKRYICRTNNHKLQRAHFKNYIQFNIQSIRFFLVL